MNIFTALFGRMKMPEPASDGYSAFRIYTAGQVKTVRTCESVTDLKTYANDHSGYVREAAIARCVELAHPELLEVIAGRLNDWVPQVRKLARSALTTLMPLVPASSLLTTLPFVLRLLDAGRTDHTEWVSHFERNLIRLVPVADLADGARGRDVKVARACFRILKNYELIDATSLINLILSSCEDIVLAVHAVGLCTGLSLEDKRVQYLTAMKSHFGAVRTFALRNLLALDIEDHKREIAIEALLDFQSSVRAVAMTYLQTIHFDLRSHYREILQQPELTAKLSQVGLMSLASLRNTDDIALVKTFVSSPRASVRLAALTAWLKLDVNDKDLVAKEALVDEASSVRKFALNAVRNHGAYIAFAHVRSTLEGRGDASLLLQFSEGNKWDWLECIARMALTGAPNGELEHRLVDGLRDWMRQAGRRYEVPSVEQIAFLSSKTTLDGLNKLLDNSEYLTQRLELEFRQGAIGTR